MHQGFGIQIVLLMKKEKTIIQDSDSPTENNISSLIKEEKAILYTYIVKYEGISKFTSDKNLYEKVPKFKEFHNKFAYVIQFTLKDCTQINHSDIKTGIEITRSKNTAQMNMQGRNWWQSWAVRWYAKSMV